MNANRKEKNETPLKILIKKYQTKLSHKYQKEVICRVSKKTLKK